MGHFSSAIGGFLALAYFAVILGVGIYLIILVARFVSAHQRGAAALEDIAKKLSSAPKI